MEGKPEAKEKNATPQVEGKQQDEATIEKENKQSDFAKSGERKFLFREDSQHIQMESERAPGIIRSCWTRFSQRYMKVCCFLTMMGMMMMAFATLVVILLVFITPKDKAV